MLIEIICDKFRTHKIDFHKGLNVVLGDEKATNSIGKSTLLMVLDFVFGGETFTKHNADVVSKLGHHDYLFSFKFGNEKHFFKRNTFSPNVVYICNSEYSGDKPFPITDYTSFLKKAYGIDDLPGSFRQLIGLYSRIWGKENLDVTKPLHHFSAQKAIDAIDNLIMLCGRYNEIQDSVKELKEAMNSKEVLDAASKQQLIPKITDSHFQNNVNLIENAKSEISTIRDNLSLFAYNLSEITNKETLDLKRQKDELLEIKLQVESKLQRVRNNLSQRAYLKSKHLTKLKDFFPDVNIERLSEIESFHVGLSKILHNELQNAEYSLSAQLSEIDSAISGINAKIKTSFASVENPTVIVDRVVELSNSLEKASQENSYFSKITQTDKSVKELKKTVKETRRTISEFICDVQNDMMRKITTIAYSEARKSPRLSIAGSNYSFEVHEDTGTGKAYSNLIIHDLSVFETTALPLLIHDSLLFKNIENSAVGNLILRYSESNRQSFIAIDEAQKYGDEANKCLHANKVIYLDSENVLYVKDWRK